MIRNRLDILLVVSTLCLLLGCSPKPDVEHANILPESTSNPPVEIPFTLTKWNNISIDATINGTDELKLMFHTDAGSVVVTQEAAKRCKTLTFDKDATMKSWGGESSSRFGTDNRLQIQSFVWDKVTVFEDVNSGHETDGKFGPGQFDGKIVEIDFEKSVLLIHETLPDKTEQFEKFTTDKGNGSFFATGNMRLDGQDIENKFLVHSGFSGVAMLDDEFVANNAALKSLPVVSESSISDSMGNVLKTQKIILPSLQFGNIQFNDIPVSMFEGAIGRQKMSLIGGDLLKRFDVILDIENSAVYLRKNEIKYASFFES